jgi:hypothetical protein
MDHLIWSSYVKVMVVLRMDSELEDKTGTSARKMDVVARI